MHYGFMARPWFKNVAKALRKEPKWFLRDWSGLADDGARAETFVASPLLKAVEGWTDLGLGDFELRYLRDKQKREVDFQSCATASPGFSSKSNSPMRAFPRRSPISRPRPRRSTPSRSLSDLARSNRRNALQFKGTNFCEQNASACISNTYI